MVRAAWLDRLFYGPPVACVAFRFGHYELDLESRRLRRERRWIHLEPRVFDLLRHLLEHRDRVVSKQELLAVVCSGRFVGEAALSTALSVARRAIGDSGRRQQVIRTVHRQGYQFVAPATEISRAGPTATAPTGQDAAPGSGARPDAHLGPVPAAVSGPLAGRPETVRMLRTAGSGRARDRTRGAHSRQPARPARRQQSPVHRRRARLARVPPPLGRVPGRLSLKLASSRSTWAGPNPP